MKKAIILLVSFLTCLNYTFSQELAGKYLDNTDYIEFNKGTANFIISNNGGLYTDLSGNGKYNIIDNFLLIETDAYKGHNSHSAKTKKANNLSQITVVDANDKPIMGVSLILTDYTDHFLFGTTTNEHGQALIENSENDNQLNLSFVGYDSYTIDYASDFDYKIVLMDYEVMENNMVVFKINSMNRDSLNLTLLSTDFKPKGLIKKDLTKLERKSRRYKYRERVLTKE
ncbi:MAG: carboxypeptidase-like regulatory domain-containing protein [Chitinophagales bacterium]|nr:carboxypeptidase regulatory-like domain-containing protein [Bacteroidota bacterium]MCB9043144.1 carboxypeptidase regulatory-like domain-containing protein [Chitinophagales bacterium]